MVKTYEYSLQIKTKIIGPVSQTMNVVLFPNDSLSQNQPFKISFLSSRERTLNQDMVGRGCSQYKQTYKLCKHGDVWRCGGVMISVQRTMLV